MCYLELTSDREPSNFLAQAVDTILAEVRQRQAKGTR
jgi:hypothetical protein